MNLRQQVSEKNQILGEIQSETDNIDKLNKDLEEYIEENIEL